MTAKRHGITHLSPAEVQQLFSGTKKTVMGVHLEPLDLPSDNPLRTVFYLEVLNKSPAQMRAHWARMTFSGRETPPLIVSTDGELQILLNSQFRNYIGYMNEDEVTDDLIVLYRPG